MGNGERHGRLRPQRRPRPYQKLSLLQKRRLLRIGGCALAAVLLALILAPEFGLYSLWRKHREVNMLARQVSALEGENARLTEEIDRLEGDAAYLEEVARRDYGLLRKDEQVFDFSRPKKKQSRD